MAQVDLKEYPSMRIDLEDKVLQRESVFIRKDENQMIQLVSVAKSRRKSQFGRAKGLIEMAEDFDEPLEVFKDYMPNIRGSCKINKIRF
ncbi:MAG: DUF2281 domain-containing protein [Candidatus Omnitrophota bacterium]